MANERGGQITNGDDPATIAFMENLRKLCPFPDARDGFNFIQTLCLGQRFGNDQLLEIEPRSLAKRIFPASRYLDPFVETHLQHPEVVYREFFRMIQQVASAQLFERSLDYTRFAEAYHNEEIFRAGAVDIDRNTRDSGAIRHSAR